MEKKPGKRARLTHTIQAVHAATIQNRSDLEDMMGVTQDTMEDLLKVTLAGIKLTIKSTDQQIEELEQQVRDLENKGALQTMNLDHQAMRFRIQWDYWNKPWWKRAFTRRPW